VLKEPPLVCNSTKGSFSLTPVRILILAPKEAVPKLEVPTPRCI